MSQGAQNLTIMSRKIGLFGYDFEHSIGILEAKNTIEPELLLLQIPIQWLIVANVWFILLFGSFLKFILYDYIYEQHKKKNFTPIDMLTLILSLSQHVITVMESIVTMLIIFSGNSLDRIVGGTWLCRLFVYLYRFNHYYSCIG